MCVTHRRRDVSVSHQLLNGHKIHAREDEVRPKRVTTRMQGWPPLLAPGSLELLKIPDGLEAFLNEEAAKQERERPTIVSFVVEDADTIEKAIGRAKAVNGQNLSRGRAIVEIAKSYLGVKNGG